MSWSCPRSCRYGACALLSLEHFHGNEALGLQDDDVMDALAQLSMSRGPGSIRSRSMHSFGSSDVIVPSDTFLDNVSLQTYGTANTVCALTTCTCKDRGHGG